MNSNDYDERWDEADRLFEAALELPVEERRMFVERSCGDDTALREKVVALLLAEERSRGFLGRSAEEALAEPSGFDTDRESLNGEEGDFATLRRIGRYRVIQEIGRGGWGTVYRAERDAGDFSQQVAIKLLRRGLDTDDVLERFRAERQILANLNHPNVARLVDGGATDDGRPYLVMELVEGVPITEYCGTRDIPLANRLRLFANVGRTVQYAHRNLVVHRDLKPSNILVTDEGEVKLLDFGIAKLIDDAAQGFGTPRTRTGFRPMTPEYASPEQVAGETITTASDVYQLGLLLYELLAGHRPHLSGRRLHDILTREEPVPPSEAVLRGSGADADARTGGRSGMEPRRLSRQLRGDLDTITLKTLRTDPERRYASVTELVEDVERYLAGQPVRARPDTWSYRARKLVRRRPGVVAVGLVLFLTGVGYGATLQSHAVGLERERDIARAERQRTELARRQANDETVRATAERDRAEVEAVRAEVAQRSAERERDRAHTEAERAERALARARVEASKAEQVTTFLTRLLGNADPASARGEQLTVRELLDRGLEDRENLPADPEVRAELIGVMAAVYQSLGLWDPALSLREEALSLQRQVHGEWHVSIMASLKALGDILFQRGDYPGAERVLDEAVAMGRVRPEYADLQVAGALESLARIYTRAGQQERGRKVTREALTIRSRNPSSDPDESAATFHALGEVLLGERDYLASLRAHQQSLEILRGAHGVDHPSVARALHFVGMQQWNTGDLDGAEKSFREGIAITRRISNLDHRRLVPSMNNLAMLLRERRSYEESERMFREVLALQIEAVGSEHPETVWLRNNLARTLTAKGEYDAAEQLFGEALSLLRRTGGPDHPNTGFLLRELAEMYAARGELDRAEQLHREALTLMRAAYGAEDLRLPEGLNHLGRVLRRRGELAAAEALHREALAIAQRTPNGDYQAARSLVELGLVQRDSGDLEGADSSLRQALEMQIRRWGVNHPSVADTRKYLRNLRDEEGKRTAAARSR
jgi:eukaryotic-like serine/threonine-protein kinase